MHACISPVHVFFFFSFLLFFLFPYEVWIFFFTYIYTYIYNIIMTKFASMIYKMIHFIHAVVEKMFFGHLVRLRDVALWVTLPSLRQQFLFRAVAHNPRAPCCTCSCSIQVRTGWSSRTMSSVGAVLLLWTFSQKVNTKKKMSVYVWCSPNTMKDFFFPPNYTWWW